MSLRQRFSSTPAPAAAASPTALSLEPRNLGLSLSLLTLFSSVYFTTIFVTYPIDAELRRKILILFFMSLGGFLTAVRLVPKGPRVISVAVRWLGSEKRELFGLDINKRGTPQGDIKVPESLGVVIGTIYLGTIILFLPFNFTADINWLWQYSLTLLAIIIALVIGFIDDAKNLRWRVKLVLPIASAVLVLLAYTGRTTIVIPKPLAQYIGVEFLDLGWLYYLYMVMLVVFCPNAVNILAGVNGLEVGQSVVVSAFVLIFNVMKISLSTDSEYELNHMISTFFVLPFFIASCALLAFNWYPASVFVGDSYTFFAGTTIAVAGILGHFSETLLVFLLPQILNFLYSLPQLFKIVPCPQHRLPSFDPKTGLLTASNDLNLVNLFLRAFGPCSEQMITIRILIFQVFSCSMGIWLHHTLAGWYK